MSACRNTTLTKTALAVMAVAVLTLAVPAVPASWAGEAERGRIHVFGVLSAAPTDDDCVSPIGWCTLGTLRGSLRGQYAYTMMSVIPAELSEAPMISFYTGQVVIETRRGRIFGADAGSIDLSPFGSGPYSSVVTVTGGEGHFAGVQGYIQITGTIDWTTGQAIGLYRGELTIP